MNLFRFEPIFTAYPLENKRDVSGGFVFSSPSCSIHCFINKLARLLRGPIWATIVEIRRFRASEGLAAQLSKVRLGALSEGPVLYIISYLRSIVYTRGCGCQVETAGLCWPTCCPLEFQAPDDGRFKGKSSAALRVSLFDL